MPLLNQLSAALPATLVYITLGAIIDIWCTVWFVFYPPADRDDAFWLMGFFGTGLVLLAIGFLVGRIGRAARKAELPPPEITDAVARVEMEAAKSGKPPEEQPQEEAAPAATVLSTSLPPSPTPPPAPAPPPIIPATSQ